MFFNFFRKHKNKNKNKKKFTSESYKKNSIGVKQMEAIANAVISKKRLFVFVESI